MNTFIQKGCIKLIKSDSENIDSCIYWFIKGFYIQTCILFIYNVTNDFYFKSMLFFWTFYSSKNPEKKWIHKNMVITNVSWAAKQHIRMICDTEDWSNDAENTALHRRNKLHLTIN